MQITRWLVRLWVAALVAIPALITTPNANATDGRVQMLDARITDAKHAEAAAQKAAETICFNAGHEVGQAT